MLIVFSYFNFVLGGLIMDEDFTLRQGLCSTLMLCCTRCSYKKEVKTSRRLPGPGQSFDVNRRAALAMSELGLGREGMATFCGIFNMLPPSQSGSWYAHNRHIHSTGKDALQEEYVTAGKRLRNLLMKEDDTLTEDSVIDNAVSYDGTWQ